MNALHDYQQEAYETISRRFRDTGKVLAVMASGLGKTVLSAFWAKRQVNKGKGLYLCHDNGIIEQAADEFRDVLGQTARLGIFNGIKKDMGHVDILFASFQSFKEWKKAFFDNEFYFIIVDESHHSAAPTFREVIDYFKPEKLFGMTATPDRMDGKDIRQIFGEEVISITLEESIAKGWLTPVEYHIMDDNFRQSALRKMVREVVEEGKKVSIKQLNETIFVEARDIEIAKQIMLDNRKTIIFCENIDHAENFKRFIPGSKTFHSRNSVRENEETLRAFREGEIQYILARDKFNEGIDIPDAEEIVFLRCTDSQTIFLQQLGRGLRKKHGKEKVVVRDYVFNCDRLIMVSEMVKRIEGFAKEIPEFDRTPMHLDGKSFNFIFTDEMRDAIEIVRRIQAKLYISDISHLASEYSKKNKLPASQVIAGTGKSLIWECSTCGWEWEVSGHSRLGGGTNCPACANKVVTPWNNLAVAYPNLAKEYMPPPKNSLPADQVMASSGSKFWWKCSKPDCGHEWETTGRTRTDGNNCPACANLVATPNNNLTVTHPHLIKEYMAPPKNKLPADKVIASSSKKFWWKCSKPECGYEWKTVGALRAKGRGCPACTNRVATPKNNLTVTHPELAKEYMAPPKNKLPADQVVASSIKKFWWKCSKPECGHEWKANGSNRVRDVGCPACSSRVVTPKNNLAVTHPELAKEYMAPPKNKLSADKVVAGSNKKFWWKCSICGWEWETDGSHRLRGTGCPKYRSHPKAKTKKK